jgi:hypothetical protein
VGEIRYEDRRAEKREKKEKKKEVRDMTRNEYVQVKGGPLWGRLMIAPVSK